MGSAPYVGVGQTFKLSLRLSMLYWCTPLCSSLANLKRVHYGLSAHPPGVKSKTYLKERPPSANIANRDFPLSSKPEDLVRQVYTLQDENYCTQEYLV